MSDVPSNVRKLQIEGLINKPKPLMEELGVFKLKDRIGRNAIRIDFDKASRPLTEAVALYITKIHGQNNGIRVSIQWKPIVEKTEPKPEEVKKDEIPK